VDCALVWNPASGRGRHRREEQAEQVAISLRKRGHRVEFISTTGPGSAGEQARNVVRQGAEIVFACGGDGTVHEVAQGLVSESGKPSASLGILPCGSANALARDLGLPLDPEAAALAQIEGSPRTVPVGKITWSGGSRYFLLMAGVGPDGALVYSLLARHKSRVGRLAYYLHAARLFATRRFAGFEVEASDAATAATIRSRAVGAMAVRIRDLGGLFAGLAGGNASIDDGHLRLILIRPPAFLSLPLWFLSAWLRIERFNPFLERIDANRCAFRPCSAIPPHLEADGEWLGRIPAEFTLLPNALRLCSPRFNLP
jgi:YegS/Rv2252/BmrU family lipid kinase